ncbi:unnamed protein product, partial [Effrenium voratum]
DNPMAAEFLTTMSGQLQSLQQVIEQVTGKIVSLQDQINSKLSVAVPKEVTQGSLTSVDKTLEVAGDLDNLAERYSAAGA